MVSSMFPNSYQHMVPASTTSDGGDDIVIDADANAKVVEERRGGGEGQRRQRSSFFITTREWQQKWQNNQGRNPIHNSTHCLKIAIILALSVTTAIIPLYQQQVSQSINSKSKSKESNDDNSSNSIGFSNNETLVTVQSALVPLYQRTDRRFGNEGGNGGDGDDQHQLLLFHTPVYASDPLPFSLHSPEQLGLESVVRPRETAPGSVFKNKNNSNSKPTNKWYENLLVGSVNEGVVTENHRAYSIPYIVDFAGAVPGLRVHYPHMLSMDTIIQMAEVPHHGLVLGAPDDGNLPKAYAVDEKTPPSQLGLGLCWTSDGAENNNNSNNNKMVGATMRTSILRGIPYATMEYSGIRPVISAEVPLAGPIRIDNANKGIAMQCGDLGAAKQGNSKSIPPDVVHVEKEVELTFAESDFTWLIVFSRPVDVSCFQAKDENKEPLPPGVVDNSVTSRFELRVVGPTPAETLQEPLIVRAALANNCTHGLNPLYCEGGKPRDQTLFKDLLRAHSDIYPNKPTIQYEFESSEGNGVNRFALIHFSWNPRNMRKDADASATEELLMYALPHHISSLETLVGPGNSGATEYCSKSLHGQACLVRGNEWVMREDLDGPPSFVAPRPPHHSGISAIADAISTDIQFELPDYYMRGAGDTYFSGKMLAKLGRIIVVADELKGLAETPGTDTFDLSDPSQRELKLVVDACKKVKLPSEEIMVDALARLRSGVEVWLNGTAEAKFIYDHEWGGLVNCGCLFNSDTMSCDNVYPNCPTFSDPGLNFGNGFYNDHHFHYGYLIYAAAVVANFDLEWGRTYFQEVLTFIRDIANPSTHDKYFPAFRQKDWYLGSSWASGIATLGGQPYLNGRNQESSSEAIHAYEAIGLYGAVMVHAFGDGVSSSVIDNDNAVVSSRVRDMGRLLTATELRSARRYWHVSRGDESRSVYPESYKPYVVGMMWGTMCQFQTWFGNAPYLSYGIQLLPLTSVSERRDAVNWARQMYPEFSKSCSSDENCEKEGWSVLQFAMLAVVGHRDVALEKAKGLPPSVFESSGGNGHSLTNTLWYIATRPQVAEPLALDESANKSSMLVKKKTKSDDLNAITCRCPETCNQNQLELDAHGYSCGSRIQYLMTSFGKSEEEACRQVAGNEFSMICAGCDPDRCAHPPDSPSLPQERIEAGRFCPPCSPKVCKGEINRCAMSLASPYLCVSGRNTGGCAQTPWIVDGDTGLCSECCLLTESCFGI